MSQTDRDRIVIVGAGQAACQLAASLRQKQCPAPITILGDEPFLPYARPPLSKAYIKDGQADRLLLRKQDFYENNGISVLTATSVVGIDRAAHQVVLAEGSRLNYGHLVLATGARNRLPPIPGADLPGMLSLRGLADAENLRGLIATVGHVGIIGGGFIGLEAASVLRAAGLRVTLFEAGPRLMARAVSEPVSAHALHLHREAGTQVHLGAAPRGIAAQGDGYVIAAQDSTQIAVDAVLLATGVTPNTELAQAAGLLVENGIVTDSHLATSDPAISAIGDCASVPQGPGGPPVRLESVQAAVDQAKCLAERLCGAPVAYARAPWFWSDQGAMKLQIAGLRTGADRSEAEQTADGRLIVRSYCGARPICVETVNHPAEHMRARRALEAELLAPV